MGLFSRGIGVEATSDRVENRPTPDWFFDDERWAARIRRLSLEPLRRPGDENRKELWAALTERAECAVDRVFREVVGKQDERAARRGDAVGHPIDAPRALSFDVRTAQ